MVIAALLFMSLSKMVLAEDQSLQSVASSGVKGKSEVVQAKILKAFVVNDDGARFRAYLVRWKGSEIIVSDPLGTSDKKEGEKITFVVQQIEIPHADENIKMLHFMIMPSTEGGTDKTLEIISADDALKNAGSEQERFYALGRAAKEAFNKGHYTVARTYAEELAALAPQYKNDWNYGNAVQDSNVVLGRLALRDGNMTAARGFLLEAGKSPGSPQMDSFGPNLSLAKDLLEKGEKEVVIEYLNDCKKFWRMGKGRLDDWIALVKGGRIPDFGPNLIY